MYRHNLTPAPAPALICDISFFFFGRKVEDMGADVASGRILLELRVSQSALIMGMIMSRAKIDSVARFTR